ncbi:hypothetical protein FA13DRAFT_1726028 [Coprinellus micaceus]|uniref:Non-structural maintenance of chromosomes element 4 n=1 Tax=Coprinellus micaceus TaxID=71717 RepID=A0A4Y7TWK0_COPMI|nr:hypothetical protein FA13DRAFT_1726028 [Coprinellus micaceus]
MAPPKESADAAFDPDQDPEVKRELRQNYRALTRHIRDQQANLNQYSTNDVLDQVKRADVLFDNVKQPQEATLDSHFLLLASNVGAAKAQAMKSGTGTFDVDDFVAKLVSYMGGKKNLNEEDIEKHMDGEDMTDVALDWAKIGRKALAKSRRVPAMGFMLGPLSIEQKKRAHTQRQRAEKNNAEVKAPQQLKEEDIQRSENETVKNVAHLQTLLEESGAVNLFKFVINPNDFAQSVENIFYLSFLIRDGKVALETNEEGEPTIYACDAPSDQDYQDGLKKNQIVLEFDMAVWKRAIEVFDITESMIPQRPPAQTKLGNKWYG